MRRCATTYARARCVRTACFGGVALHGGRFACGLHFMERPRSRTALHAPATEIMCRPLAVLLFIRAEPIQPTSRLPARA